MTANRRVTPATEAEVAARALVSSSTPAGELRAVLYLRVSTERQARSGGEVEGYSIPAQRDAGKRKAESLGAVVVDEYVDAGASAKTADRAGLQSLLSRLEDKGDVDLVVIHKLDRLARSRMDDVLIMAAIERAGARLVSCTETLDESPQGKLLHGIMASMAEFYVQNLANEAKKGLHEKARKGGTPGPAPIGYLNKTVRTEGIDVKTVVLDEERAPHLLWAFESYATGQWSLSELTEELDRRGLRSRPTRRYAGRALKRSQVHRALCNPYYSGKVIYGGVIYDGRHQALVDDETFALVQHELERRKVAGDRAWKLQQYLKGSVFCERRGERLGFGFSTGRSGDVYPYFFCLGRHRRRTSCDLPYLPAAKAEAAVCEEWDQTTFPPELLRHTSEVVADEFDRMMQRDAALLADQGRRLLRLDRQREKLLDGFMDGLIGKEDFAGRQDRIDRELREAKRLIESAQTAHDGVREQIEVNLRLMERAGLFYRHLHDSGRQTLNQARFDELFLDIDESGRVFVADRNLTDLVAAFEALTDGVRADLGMTVTPDDPNRPAARRRYHRPQASGWREGSRHPQDLENEHRRQGRPELVAQGADGGST